MAVVFALTIQSPTALITRHPENTWATGGPATIVTRTAAGGTPIGTHTVTATIVVVGVVMIGIKIKIETHMDATVVTGATDAAQRQAGAAADDIRPTTGVAGVIPEARLGEAAPPEVLDGTMMHRPEVPPLQPMRLGGERLAIACG